MPDEPFVRSSFLDLLGYNEPSSGLSRRAFLGTGAGLVLGGVLGSALSSSPASAAVRARGALSQPKAITAIQRAGLDALGKEHLRQPLSLPDPSLLPGTDTMPGIEHVVVVMLENHSFDNVFGMLGRGDGYKRGAFGQPLATNPYADGRIQHAFHMPCTCQLPSQPSQEWSASNNAYAGGKMNGFVSTPISHGASLDVGGVAMGYFNHEDLPCTYSIAKHFPIADRWFCSVLGQTDPNRRYLIAGTSFGMTDDISTSASVGTAKEDATLVSPNLTIFDLLTAFNISWVDYNASYPLGETANLNPTDDAVLALAKNKPIAQFYTDAAAGKLPSFCLVEPDYNTQSQENPQNMALGDALLGQVVKALGDSPLWEKSLLIFTYDEHGGYYDHVPPPVSLAPDDIPPIVVPGESTYEGFERYGIRVPGMVISPYAKRDYVSSQVYDHTSMLAFVERKWNLPALTLRDANANDLTDLIDLGALADGSPTFATMPTIAAPNTAAMSCTGPGVIPPPGSITAA